MWHTLPRPQRQNALRTLPAMALRRIRPTPVIEESCDDVRRVRAGAPRLAAGQDRQPARGTLGDRLRPAVHAPADRAPPGIDTPAIRPGGPGRGVRVGSRARPGDR